MQNVKSKKVKKKFWDWKKMRDYVIHIPPITSSIFKKEKKNAKAKKIKIKSNSYIIYSFIRTVFLTHTW